MRRINPFDPLRVLDRHDIRQINSNGLSITTHQHTLQLLVFLRIDLLVRHVRRDVDEIPGSSLGGKLEFVSPAHTSPALNDVNHTFQMPVVVGPRFRVRVDFHRPCPQLLGADTGGIDGGSTVHAGRLGSVAVQAVAGDHAYAALSPGVGRLVG